MTRALYDRSGILRHGHPAVHGRLLKALAMRAPDKANLLAGTCEPGGRRCAQRESTAAVPAGLALSGGTGSLILHLRCRLLKPTMSGHAFPASRGVLPAFRLTCGPAAARPPCR